MRYFRPTVFAWVLFALEISNTWAVEFSCRGMGRQVQDFDLNFSLTHSQIPGEVAMSNHKLRVSGAQYKLESISQAKGVLALLYSGQLSQKSEGLIDMQLGFVPHYYAEQRGKKPIAESTLNVEMQQVLFKRNGQTAPYEKRLQDRLSMIYQMSARLRCSSDLKIGDSLALRVMGTGRLTKEVFVLQKEEEVILNGGQGERRVNTLQFESRPEDASDEIVRIWYSKNLNWQPVKIQIQDKDGKSLTQTLVGG